LVKKEIKSQGLERNMSKNFWLQLLVLVSIFLAGCTDHPPVPNINNETENNAEEQELELVEPEEEESSFVEDSFIPATVVRVVDGDTIIVKLENGQEERVRLLLVDTPESVHPNKPIQPFGLESSEFAKELMRVGETIKLEMDVSERDRYGRLLAYVWVGDKMFNELLLEKGLARVAYVFAPNTRHVDRFYEIQKKAQQQAIGIWSIENYATDSGFNEDVVIEEEAAAAPSLSCDNPTIKGNHSSNGELIYHVPGGQYYERTNPEEMFCTEEEAEAVGYRKSMR
jgi:micrococcal nuclease